MIDLFGISFLKTSDFKVTLLKKNDETWGENGVDLGPFYNWCLYCLTSFKSN